MRATRQRPSSQHSAYAAAPTSAPSTTPQVRKVFNCIVDDSALVAGVKRSTRNGIRHWVKNGQIRLFVPLHALDQLSRQRSATTRYAEDVRETLQWLDDATSNYPTIVTLQGADEIYERWADVQKFAVPRTLFSESDVLDDDHDTETIPASSPDADLTKITLDDVLRHTSVSSEPSDASRPLSPSSMRSQRSSLSAHSPPTSPIKPTSPQMQSNLVQDDQTASSSSATVPTRLQPLFNYILWRVHQELDPVAALESFIFLCNDQSKVNFAKGFDIKTKRLEQLRDAIGREDRDFRNRQMVTNRENQNSATSTATAILAAIDSYDPILTKSPPKAPAAMLSKQAQQQRPGVIDPDAFSRNPALTPVQQPMLSPRLHHAVPQAMSPPYTPRGGSPRGNNFRGAPRGRAAFNNAPARGKFVANNHRMDSSIAPDGQIDPNSFARPRGSGHPGRGGRKLWVPTT